MIIIKQLYITCFKYGNDNKPIKSKIKSQLPKQENKSLLITTNFIHFLTFFSIPTIF